MFSSVWYLKRKAEKSGNRSHMKWCVWRHKQSHWSHLNWRWGERVRTNISLNAGRSRDLVASTAVILAFKHQKFLLWVCKCLTCTETLRGIFNVLVAFTSQRRWLVPCIGETSCCYQSTDSGEDSHAAAGQPLPETRRKCFWRNIKK